ncbi:hypothetical protein MJT46_015939 [Ovis ammon polii x Ovis aries]|nr:hypothetical protein MJT46_015939 [Ovis ammon polii x Ovis aries]
MNEDILKDGHVCQIVIEDVDETVLSREARKEKKNKKPESPPEQKTEPDNDDLEKERKRKENALMNMKVEKEKTEKPPPSKPKTSASKPKKEGHLIQIVIEDYEEITVMRKKEQKKKREKAKNGRRERAAKKIQAWWRGTLVRRTLLHAALSTWIIQSWWKLTMDRLLQKKRRAALIAYAHRERAVVKLQSLVRMWRIHWRYCQVLNAIYVIQHHWQYHNCQTCALLRGHCVVTATHLQFHIEIINP